MEERRNNESIMFKFERVEPIADRMIEISENEEKLNKIITKNSGKKKNVVLWVIGLIYLYSFLAASASGEPISIVYGSVTAICVLLYVRRKIKVINAKKKIANLEDEYSKLRENEALEWIPISYRNGYDIILLMKYFINDRADTIREAINILEAEKQNARMVNAAATGAYYGAKNRY